MRIDVTQEDIDKGVKRNCEKCPVALAASRALGKRVEIYTYGGMVLQEDESRVFFSLPMLVLEFIYAFDYLSKTSQPKPFSFEINLT